MSQHDDLTTTMERAIRAVRREGYKAATIYAVLDGTLVGLLANLLVTVGGVAVVTPAVVAAAVGVTTAIASFVLRVRQPLVERFESVNPEVHEALRTARDAVADGDTSPMARALYAEVVDRLRTTSNVGLVSLPRVAGRFVLVFVVSLALIQSSMAGFELGVGPTEPGPGGPTDGNDGVPAGPTTTPTGLQPADDVLGEPTTVTPGGENFSAEIGQQAGRGNDRIRREYETGGLGDDATIEAQRAGYAPPDDLEEAALIKAYNLRIRESTDE